MSTKLTVLIVDDSAFTRQTFKSIVEQEPGIEVVGIASDGMDAMNKTLRLNPDLILLDYQMPEMDGMSFLRWVMAEKPTPVLMVSSHSDPEIVLEALELGAVDFVAKPTSRSTEELRAIERELLMKIRSVREMDIRTIKKNVELLESKTALRLGRRKVETDVPLVAIGASTGGPTAIQMILADLPPDMPCPVVISQHMPRGYTWSFAERLNRLSGLTVKEAEEGELLRAGAAYICPGGWNMTFRRVGADIYVSLEEAGESQKFIPSVNSMLLSASGLEGRPFGVVLTGMGDDGAKGLKAIKDSGGITVAESEETSVVFGMPGEAIRAGGAESVLPVDKVAMAIRHTVFGDRAEP